MMECILACRINSGLFFQYIKYVTKGLIDKLSTCTFNIQREKQYIKKILHLQKRIVHKCRVNQKNYPFTGKPVGTRSLPSHLVNCQKVYPMFK